jgi:drug/metabolite transporter (DMT)-like permease
VRGPAAPSPRLALLAAVFATSWGSILARLCVSGPLGVAFYRLLFSALIVLPAVLLRPPESVKRRGRRPALLVPAAGLLLALHFATWITSLWYTSIGASVVLVSMAPVFAVVLSRIFLREAASIRTVAAVIVALAGTAVITGGDLDPGLDHWKGDLLALAGALFMAAYLLIGRSVRAEIAFGGYLFGVYATGAAFMALLAFSVEGPGASFPERDWIWLVLMAAGPGVAGHGLLNWSVRHLRTYVVNAAQLGEPILATFYAWVLLGERPGAHLYAGGVLVIAGLAWVFREEGRRARQGPAL